MKEKVGYNIEDFPKKVTDNDKKCPYYGEVSVRGRFFEGKVVSDSMLRTVKVEWERVVKQKKYNRFLKKSSSVLAHNPECISAKNGDTVLIAETRPLSKRKHFVILKIIKGEISK